MHTEPIDNKLAKMDILLVGAGVIGTVYGAQLAAAGHTVSIYDHGERTQQIKTTGLIAKDLATGTILQQAALVVRDTTIATYDLVLISVRQDALPSIFPIIKRLSGKPTVLFFGNNPRGRLALPKDFSKTIEQGFPGVSGALVGDTVEYIRIAEQPTVIQQNVSMPTLEFAKTLCSRGFKIARVSDMDGWLLYHAVFVACISAALYRCYTNPTLLSKDHATLTLMCQAIEEGFHALRGQGIGGQPRNLRILHLSWLRPFAIRYWSRTLGSPKGELEFAAHSRHARGEMKALAKAVLAATANGSTQREHFYRLLRQDDTINL
jgi:2-dehydropantoate 2-reductase